MVENIVLNASQLEVMASPASSEVLTCLNGIGKASATEVAKKLGKSPATVIYHLRKLESVGLAEVVERQATSRRPQAVYSPAALRLQLPEFDEKGLITRAVLASMREAMRGFADAPGMDYKHILRVQTRLTPEDANEFIAMLEAANRFAGERQVTEGVHLHWSSVVYPESGGSKMAQDL